MANFKTLPGFREFYPEDYAKKSYLFSCWRGVARSFGFQEFEPPVLEQLDLFTEKSGEEIKSQLFEFVDKGERAVSLRPEMTPSLARMVGAKAAGIRRPVKWFAIGENYRYERQQKGRLRAFYQFNADILGEASLNADAEIIALLIESLRVFGLDENQFKLRLGDRNLWVLFLQNSGVEDERLIAVLSVIDKLEKVSPEALLDMMKTALEGSKANAEKLIENIRQLVALRSVDALEEFFNSIGVQSENIALRLKDWRDLLALLDSMDVAKFVSVDMGIVRGLAYYTGFVFEAFQTVGTGRALAGGGRYDNLVAKLGYQDMPAVGFGMGDVTVSDLLELVGLEKSDDFSPQVYVIIGSENVRKNALSVVRILRSAGIRTDYPFKSAGFGKQFKQADALGAKYAVIVGEDEVAKGVVKIKNLKTAEEREVAISEIVSAI
ncbi:MAG: histidine--tRNA ligase [Verrucomicrobiaceae bacterium]|nr:histidine--tRNA ligase [Verrucomicrobiaceae bacterium]